MSEDDAVLLAKLQTLPITNYNVDTPTVQEFENFLADAFEKNPPPVADISVNVWVGWMGKDDDKYWAEIYTISGNGMPFDTGRAGFLLFYKNTNKILPGFPIKYFIFKKPMSRDDFLKTMELEEAVAAIDRELNIDWTK